MPNKKTILLIGTFDTKGEEFSYTKDLILERGHRVILMDVGILEDPVNMPPDVTSDEVAKAGGSNLKIMRSTADRGQAIDVMIEGVEKIVPKLFLEKQFDAVLSLGGGAGTNIATAGMRQLPVGVPKVMVSTLASSDVSSYVGIKDITMIYSVTDIAGLNRLSRQVLSNAVGAVCGMAEQVAPSVEERPLIAASMFGVTTPCVSEVRRKLENAGYELLVFHATGTGGRAMEGLIEDGFFDAVADITTTEWADQVVGGVLSAGEDRLGAAGRKAIPQVVSCGALDMVNFHSIETVPEDFKNRNLYKHNPTVTLMRTTADECQRIGKKIAEKLNEANGPVTMMLPLRGVSSLDTEEQPFFNPRANRALFDSLRESVSENVNLVELDLHINDPEFSERIVEELLSML